MVEIYNPVEQLRVHLNPANSSNLHLFKDHLEVQRGVIKV
jgi:hypothetical protein